MIKEFFQRFKNLNTLSFDNLDSNESKRIFESKFLDKFNYKTKEELFSNIETFIEVIRSNRSKENNNFLEKFIELNKNTIIDNIKKQYVFSLDNKKTAELFSFVEHYLNNDKDCKNSLVNQYIESSLTKHKDVIIESFVYLIRWDNHNVLLTNKEAMNFIKQYYNDLLNDKNIKMNEINNLESLNNCYDLKTLNLNILKLYEAIDFDKIDKSYYKKLLSKNISKDLFVNIMENIEINKNIDKNLRNNIISKIEMYDLKNNTSNIDFNITSNQVLASTIALVIASDITDDTKHSYVNAETSSSFTSHNDTSSSFSSHTDTSSCASFDFGSSAF